MSGMIFYHSPGSSSMATHIALHEIGVPFESRVLAFATREHRSPGYLAVNPEGKVPCLVIGGRRLTEVAGTLYYLARRFPDAKLLPAGDIDAESQVVSWMSFIASTMHPARGKGIEHAAKIYRLVENRIGAGPWAVNGAYSIADIHMFRIYWRYRVALQPPPGTFPVLDAHFERMMARPAVKKTIEIETQIGYDLP